MRVLELFSGSGSISKICRERDWECVSLDIDGRADINIDIMKWDYVNAFPVGYFDYIHASPPCETFSNLRRSWIGRKLKQHGDIIITKEILDNDMETIGVPLLRKTQDIIFHFEPTYWTIENPQGKMKNYMKSIPHYIIDYCMYSDWGYKKTTIFWTNIEGFEPKRCNGHCENMSNGRHMNSMGSDYIGGGIPLCDRYRIPPIFINELFEIMIK